MLISESWDRRWMSLAQLVSSWSKDRSRKTGAVIIDHRNVVLSLGWNGFPRKVNDDVNRRHERPAKYLWTEHAERNAIYNAAAKGVECQDTRMYITWYPCAPCARAIIQAGIIEIVGLEPDWNDQKWAEDFKEVREMLLEAEICVRFFGRRDE